MRASRRPRWLGRSVIAIGLFALLLCSSFAGAADPAPVSPEASWQWYSVILDGRKIGQMSSRRQLTAAGVNTEQHLRLNLQRDGQALQILSEQSTLESPAGEPLGFRNLLQMGGSRSESVASIVDDVAVVRWRGPVERVERVAWPAGALLTEGLRLAALRHGSDTGVRYTLLNFDLDALRAVAVETQVLGVHEIEVAGQSEQTLALRQTMHVDSSDVASDVWVSAEDFAVRRMRLPMLGVKLDILACDQACADAPDQPTDILAATSVAAPRALTARERQRPLRYRMRFEGRDPLAIPLPGQRHEVHAGRLQVIVSPGGDSDQPPTAADLAPNRWLQSDHQRLIALAEELAGGAESAAGRMQRLELGVSRHLVTKSLRIGYASALEAAELAEGDCTEHALLLAALGRAQGIPTRVASGLAYVTTFGNRHAVFVPHAWVYAWVDGRWQGYDAALPSFGSGHLALDVGDGDPFGFFAGLDLLGRLHIDAIDPVRSERSSR